MTAQPSALARKIWGQLPADLLRYDDIGCRTIDAHLTPLLAAVDAVLERSPFSEEHQCNFCGRTATHRKNCAYTALRSAREGAGG